MAEEIVLVGTTNGLQVCQYIGATWATRVLLGNTAISQIDAVDAMTLVVADADGATQQTFDGGETWLPGGRITSLPAAPLVMTADGPTTLLAPRLSHAVAYARLRDSAATLIGAGANGMMLFRSSDSGIHWAAANSPMDAGRIVALAPSVRAPAVCWAGTERGALLRSTDSGTTWQVVAHVDGAVQVLVAVRV